ncbi:histidine kinase [Bacillus sp. F19]|nr:histidine kinase [Bacillus sp. F19]
MDPLLEKDNVISYLLHLQEQECKRIGLEFHEGVAQNLYSVYTGLQFIEQGLQNDALKNFMNEMIRSMETGIGDIRRLSTELYPITLSTLGLVPAIKQFAVYYTSTFGIVINVKETGNRYMLEEAVNLAVYRVCQEAFTNAAKYADVEEMDILISSEKEKLQVVIRDNGRGFLKEKVIAENKAPGLLAMKERIRLVGGDCRISSEINKGTQVTVTVPAYFINHHKRRDCVDKDSAGR